MRSIQWGAWSGVGMVATSAAVLARMERSGISAVDPRMGLQALQSILIVSSSTVSASKGSNTLCNVVRLQENCSESIQAAMSLLDHRAL